MSNHAWQQKWFFETRLHIAFPECNINANTPPSPHTHTPPPPPRHILKGEKRYLRWSKQTKKIKQNHRKLFLKMLLISPAGLFPKGTNKSKIATLPLEELYSWQYTKQCFPPCHLRNCNENLEGLKYLKNRHSMRQRSQCYRDNIVPVTNTHHCPSLLYYFLSRSPVPYPR